MIRYNVPAYKGLGLYIGSRVTKEGGKIIPYFPHEEGVLLKRKVRQKVIRRSRESGEMTHIWVDILPMTEDEDGQ